MTRRTIGPWAALTAILMVTGCYEKPEVKLHQPGEYQGTKDPLLQTSSAPEHDDKLADRLRMVQTDR